MSDQAIVITGEQIPAFRVQVIRRGLELEVRTGMKHSRNATATAARHMLLAKNVAPARTKKALLVQFNLHYPPAQQPQPEGNA